MYGRLCGRVLAYGHARSSDRISIAAYLGSDAEFDDAIATFADVYSQRNERDRQQLVDAIDQGLVKARAGI